MTTVSSIVTEAQPAADAGEVLPNQERLMSLDVFRGATIASMLLVNDPGTWSAVYPPLLPAPCTAGRSRTLIFPFFLWIVGVSMALSTESRVSRGPYSAASCFTLAGAPSSSSLRVFAVAFLQLS